MAQHVLRVADEGMRAKVAAWVLRVPLGGLVKFEPEPKRSTVQNAKMWAMLGDISKQVEHAGKHHTPEVWKCIMLNALGHEVAFVQGLEGEIFPIGFKSSNLSVGEMANLIELIYSHGAKCGVKWTEKGFDV